MNEHRSPASKVSLLALLLLAGSPACERPRPARPHLVLVTVAGLPADGVGDAAALRQLAEECVRFEAMETPGTSVFDALSVLHTGLSLAEQPRAGAGELAPPGGPGAPLPGAVDTLFERALPKGYESAAVVSDSALGLVSGLTQGAAHVLDREFLQSREDGAQPVVAALNAAVAFLDARLERRVEHGALVWLHLDLSELPALERGAFLDGALARISASLEADPRHVLAMWFLPPEGSGQTAAPFWLRVPGQAVRADGEVTDPIHVAPTLLSLLGAHPPLPAQPPFAPLPGRDLLGPAEASAR